MILKSKYGLTYNTERVYAIEVRYWVEGQFWGWQEKNKYKTIISTMDALRYLRAQPKMTEKQEFRIVHYYPDENYPYCWFR